MAANRTIVLKSPYGQHEEARASAAITPGMVLQMGSDGRVAPKATAGAATPCMIAKEDAYQGKTVDNAYAINDVVFFWTPNPGDHGNVLLATGQNAAIGSILINNTAGTYNVAVAETTQRDWQALEALNNASGAAMLIRARKL